MLMSEIDVIIEAIKDLPLKEALALLASKKILNFIDEEYKKIKQIIRDKQNEYKYAFVPDKEEAQKLIQFSTDPNYKGIESLVPRYRYIDLLVTGLLIDFFHKRNKPEDIERVTRIKNQILRRPNGSHLLKITHLSETPFFSVVSEYMYYLKKNNYSEKQLEEALDEIVQRWDSSSKFFKTKDKEKDIIFFCNRQISESKPFFFILGMKTVADKIERAIRKVSMTEDFKEKNYEYNITKLEEGNQPRIEVRVIQKPV